MLRVGFLLLTSLLCSNAVAFVATTHMPASRVIGEADLYTTPAPWTSGSTEPDEVRITYAIATDSVNDRVFVADSPEHRVVEYVRDAGTGNYVFNRVFGQPDEYTGRDTALPFKGGNRTNVAEGCTTTVNACGMYAPHAVAYIPSDQTLVVADQRGARILFFDAVFGVTTPMPRAKIVLAQPSFEAGATDHWKWPSQGTWVNAENIDYPQCTGTTVHACGTEYVSGLVWDSCNGVIWAADSQNQRVLGWQYSSITDVTGPPADYVLGTNNLSFGDFYRSTESNQVNLLYPQCSTPTTNACNFDYPNKLGFDDSRCLLFVSDLQNNRVLVFDDPDSEMFKPAVYVWGQPDFFTSTEATGSNKTPQPQGLTYDSVSDRMYVSSRSLSGVLTFPMVASLTNHPTASAILGNDSFVDGLHHVSCGGTPNIVDPCGMKLGADLAFLQSQDQLFVANAFGFRVIIFE